MSTTPTPKDPTKSSSPVIDSLTNEASELASAASAKLEAVKDIFKTIAATNETFRKSIESNEKVTSNFFNTLSDAVKSAQSSEERERLLKMGQETLREANDTSESISNKAYELGKGAIIVLGVIAAGTAAIVMAKNKSD